MPERDPLPQLDLDRQLCFPLYAATRAVTRRYAVLLEEFGLTYPQYLTLLALWGSEDPLTVGELGTRLRLDSGTLTPLLKRLEVAGHVRRERDSADERRVHVVLTEQGWRLRDKVAHVPKSLIDGIDLTAAQGEELRRLLGRIIDDGERSSP